MFCVPQLEPDFEGAARDLKAEGVTLAKVNGQVEKDLSNTYDIKGYPTLIVSPVSSVTLKNACVYLFYICFCILYLYFCFSM